MKGDSMTRDELKQRINEARAENVDGTCSRAWRKMVDYVEQQNAGQWREQALALEAENEMLRKRADRLQHDLERAERLWSAFCDKGNELSTENDRLGAEVEGWRGSAAYFADEVCAAEAEIAKLRESVDELDRFAEQMTKKWRAEKRTMRKWRQKSGKLEVENKWLCDALNKLEPFAYTAFARVPGQDGKWHDERTCRVCGAVIEMHEDRHGAGHRYDCVFAR